jgi:hypothetical protein
MVCDEVFGLLLLEFAVVAMLELEVYALDSVWEDAWSSCGMHSRQVVVRREEKRSHKRLSSNPLLVPRPSVYVTDISGVRLAISMRLRVSERLGESVRLRVSGILRRLWPNGGVRRKPGVRKLLPVLCRRQARAPAVEHNRRGPRRGTVCRIDKDIGGAWYRSGGIQDGR